MYIRVYMFKEACSLHTMYVSGGGTRTYSQMLKHVYIHTRKYTCICIQFVDGKHMYNWSTWITRYIHINGYRAVLYLLKETLALKGNGSGSLRELAPKCPEPRPQVLLVKIRIDIREGVQILLGERERSSETTIEALFGGVLISWKYMYMYI